MTTILVFVLCGLSAIFAFFSGKRPSGSPSKRYLLLACAFITGSFAGQQWITSYPEDNVDPIETLILPFLTLSAVILLSHLLGVAVKAKNKRRTVTT